MKTGTLWWRYLAVISLITATILGGPRPPSAQGQARERDCTLSSVGLTPLTDLGTGTYNGATGGLYPGGVNDIPPAHLATGLARAGAIEPLDESGNPSPDGKVVFASVGFSNPEREFGELVRLVPSIDNLDNQVVVVNGAQGGEHILKWSNPNGRPWQGLERELGVAGVTAPQVQGLWVKMAHRAGVSPDLPFPDNARTYEAELATVVRLLQERLPNLQVAYVSSRAYGGYGGEASPSPEPVAYEEGFGVKWLIERQMSGDVSLNADPTAGPIEAPWLAWGPYLWADGTTARQDGLTWACAEYRGDGVHLEATGNRKVATMLLDFLESEPTAAWLFNDRELPPPPEDLGNPVPTSTLPSDTTSRVSTTAAVDNETTSTTTGAGASTETTSASPSEPGTVPGVVWVVVGAAGGLLVGAGIYGLIERRRRHRNG